MITIASGVAVDLGLGVPAVQYALSLRPEAVGVHGADQREGLSAAARPVKCEANSPKPAGQKQSSSSKPDQSGSMMANVERPAGRRSTPEAESGTRAK